MLCSFSAYGAMTYECFRPKTVLHQDTSVLMQRQFSAWVWTLWQYW